MKFSATHLFAAALVASTATATATVQRPFCLAVGRGRAAAHRRAWLRLLLLAMLWSSVQGLLGWWVVQATAQPGQAVVEVCTPHGMQWVALDGTVGESPAAPADGSATLGQPCVWAAAALSLPAAHLPQGLCAALAPAQLHLLGSCRAPIPHDTVARVLLMAPMRAPPLA